MEQALKQEFKVDYSTVVWHKKFPGGTKTTDHINRAHISQQYIYVTGPNVGHNVSMWKCCTIGMTPDKKYLVLKKSEQRNNLMDNYKVQLITKTTDTGIRAGSMKLIKDLKLKKGIYPAYSDAVNNSVVIELF